MYHIQVLAFLVIRSHLNYVSQISPPFWFAHGILLDATSLNLSHLDVCRGGFFMEFGLASFGRDSGATRYRVG